MPNKINSTNYEDELVNPSDELARTIATRVTEDVYQALMNQAIEWGITQSEAQRKILLSFLEPPLIIESLEFYRSRGLGSKGEIDAHFYLARLLLYLTELKNDSKRVEELLADIKAREERIINAVGVMQDYFREHPYSPMKGGDVKGLD